MTGKHRPPDMFRHVCAALGPSGVAQDFSMDRSISGCDVNNQEIVDIVMKLAFYPLKPAAFHLHLARKRMRRSHERVSVLSPEPPLRFTIAV